MNEANDAPAIRVNGSSNWVSKVKINVLGQFANAQFQVYQQHAFVVKTLMYITFYPAIKLALSR